MHVRVEICSYKFWIAEQRYLSGHGADKSRPSTGISDPIFSFFFSFWFILPFVTQMQYPEISFFFF